MSPTKMPCARSQVFRVKEPLSLLEIIEVQARHTSIEIAFLLQAFLRAKQM